jgi:beta-lactamase superfamily II metal-dependent hydrolase
MAFMRFVVLDVGQGTGNFVEIYDDGGSLVNAMLIDLGSEGWKRIAGKPSADWVAERLKTMPGGAKLDAVFLSHSDSDHVNLIKRLLEHFVPPGKPGTALTVHQVYYGGDYGYYKKGKGRSATNYLDELNKYRPSGSGSVLTPCSPNGTSFTDADPKKWVPMKTIGNVQVWLISGNTTPDDVALYAESETGSKAPEGYAINTKSMVLLVTYAGTQIAVTGDATGMTLAKCNEIMARGGVLPYLNNVFSLTLPHHGSDTTTFSLLGATDDAMDVQELADENVRSFVDNVKPQTISASAARRESFRHPSARVIDFFGTHLDWTTVYFTDDVLKADKQHFYTAYFPAYARKLKGGMVAQWPSKSGWYTARTSGNIFSTDYYRPEQALGDFVALPPAPAIFNAAKTAYKPVPKIAAAWGFTVVPGVPAPTRQIAPLWRASDLRALPPEHAEALVGRPIDPDEDFVWGVPVVTAPSPEPPTGAVPVTDPEAGWPASSGSLSGLQQLP